MQRCGRRKRRKIERIVERLTRITAFGQGSKRSVRTGPAEPDEEVFMLRILLLALLLLSQPSFAQHHGPHQERVATLIPNLGTLHHPVSTKSAAAQKFFDQGLTLVYAFMHEEAVRSFQRAGALDPQLAMAHWGVALALGPNYNMEMETEQGKKALAAIRRAQELAGAASQRDQDYIAALSKRYTDQIDVDPKKPNIDYAAAMKALAQKYPDDVDAATLYADSMMVLRPWQLWSNDGKPAEGTDEIVATLESVLKRQPDHIGANHLYIHAIEASREPQKGLDSAKRLATLAPAAGHLVHMPAHIYDRVGDYAGAVHANAVGAAADRAFIKRYGGEGMYPMMYYNHNLHFLAIANATRGHYRAAMAAAAQLGRHVAPAVKDVPMLEGFLPTATLINVHFQKWDLVLKAPRPPESQAGATALWRFARTMAFAARGDVAAAKTERDGIVAAAAAIPKEATWGNNKPTDVLKVATGLADAQIAMAANEATTAMTEYANAAKAEDGLAYDEPQPWPLPVREWWGAALLKTGDAAAAESAYRAELEKHPNSGRALFGLSAALKAQRKPTGQVDREAAKAWRGADTKPALAMH
jgi:tetratricopeptide (TPR) repeat protein